MRKIDDDMDDKDLEILFRETRVIDHKSAPRFDHDWDAARSRFALGRKAPFNYAIAAACIIAIVAGVAVALRIARMRWSIPQQSVSNQGPARGASDWGSPSGPPIDDATAVLRPDATANSEHKPVPIEAGFKNRVRRHHLRPEQYSAPPGSLELLSAWRSPTEFLLRSPADDLLRAVPRIQDSMVRLDDN
jgi:hypothetical protein